MTVIARFLGWCVGDDVGFTFSSLGVRLGWFQEVWGFITFRREAL